MYLRFVKYVKITHVKQGPVFRKIVRFNRLVELTTCLIRNKDYAVVKMCIPKAILPLFQCKCQRKIRFQSILGYSFLKNF